MGRGDKGDTVGKDELDETVLATKAGPDGETSVTDLPLDETASMGPPTKLGAKSGPGTDASRSPEPPPTTKPPSDVTPPDSAKPDGTGSKTASAGKAPAGATFVDKPSRKPQADKTPPDTTSPDKTPPAKGRPDTPRPQAPPEEPPAVARHRRGPGLWLPLIIFVVLLVAGAVAGSVVVPGAGPNPGAAPPASAAAPGLTTPVPAQPSATRSDLPTPPVRPADQLASWAQRIGGVLNVPAVAIQAYGYAALAALNTDPSCHLSWTTVAAIGEVESQHGQIGGAVLQSGGRSAPLIVGPVLDGKNGHALVNDTDAGAFDGDTTYDRAMGPLGLTPTVWRTYGIDADQDGILDPYDIDDASLALARLLCSGPEDLSQRSGWDAAVARQHTGSTYAKSVFTSADSYGQRTKNMG